MAFYGSHNVLCDSCFQNIMGVRWICNDCPSYNSCETCYDADRHDSSHEFYCIGSPGNSRSEVSARSSNSVSGTEIFGIILGVGSLLALQYMTSDSDRHSANCDTCGERKIQGTRWQCRQCYSYDLCDQCYKQGRHSLSHQFYRIEKPGGTRELVAARITNRRDLPSTSSSSNTFSNIAQAAENFSNLVEATKQFVSLFSYDDTTQSLVIICNYCRQSISGLRWSCSECEGIDLCNTCYGRGRHYMSHAFYRTTEHGTSRTLVAPRNYRRILTNKK